MRTTNKLACQAIARRAKQLANSTVDDRREEKFREQIIDAVVACRDLLDYSPTLNFGAWQCRQPYRQRLKRLGAQAPG